MSIVVIFSDRCWEKRDDFSVILLRNTYITVTWLRFGVKRGPIRIQIFSCFFHENWISPRKSQWALFLRSETMSTVLSSSLSSTRWVLARELISRASTIICSFHSNRDMHLQARLPPPRACRVGAHDASTDAVSMGRAAATRWATCSGRCNLRWSRLPDRRRAQRSSRAAAYPRRREPDCDWTHRSGKAPPFASAALYNGQDLWRVKRWCTNVEINQNTFSSAIFSSFFMKFFMKLYRATDDYWNIHHWSTSLKRLTFIQHDFLQDKFLSLLFKLFIIYTVKNYNNYNVILELIRCIFTQ